MLLGSATAAAVTLFEFPGRRHLEWALLLPLAMPAYVLAYAWTDALQFSGPLQSALRNALGQRGALWPDVRSLPGAVALFVLCLYPYVYLLTRAALGERAVRLMEAARLLGADPMRRRMLEVALPLARPAVVAGVALALMETLADYGVGAYFGLSTFTTGIYRAWLVMNDRIAAAQLAIAAAGGGGGAAVAERRAQRRLRFASSRSGRRRVEARPVRLRGAAGLAGAGCCAPCQCCWALYCQRAGWLHMLWQEIGHRRHSANPGSACRWSALPGWAWSSFRLAGARRWPPPCWRWRWPWPCVPAPAHRWSAPLRRRRACCRWAMRCPVR